MTYHGVIRGKTIELDETPSLPEGQDVTIEIHPFRPGDGIRASAGAWADAGPEAGVPPAHPAASAATAMARAAAVPRRAFLANLIFL